MAGNTNTAAAAAAQAADAYSDALTAPKGAATVAANPDAPAITAKRRDAVLGMVAALGTVTGSHPRNRGGAPVTLPLAAMVDALAAAPAAQRTALVANALHATATDADAARAVALVLGYVASTARPGAQGLWGAVGGALGYGSPGAARTAYAAAVQGVRAPKGHGVAATAAAWATAHGKGWAAADALRGMATVADA